MRKLNSRILRGALLILALVAAGPGAAQTRRGSCSMSIFPLSFGAYDVFSSSPTRSVTRILVDCDRTVGKIRTRIELSTGSSQSYAKRTQMSGRDALTYNIYTDYGLTQIAGDGTSGTSAIFIDTGLFGRDWVDLYGAIDPRQFVPPGSYFDAIYVTLIF